MRVLLAVVSTLLLASSLAGASFPRGEIVENVIVEGLEGVEGQSYALYLPTGYTAERRWPVLFVLDPRGRGTLAAELFREGAERFGWIIASSNNSRSDTDVAVNYLAIRGLSGDAPRRLSIDQRRIYLAGFSGTSRFSWSLAVELGDNVAGVIGCGGGTPPPQSDWLRGSRFPYFGAAGKTDFNYDEMLDLYQQLDRTDQPHRFERFDGAHQWLPAGLATEAIGWMDLQAMRSGLREPDAEIVAALFAEWLGKAEALERDGLELEALRQYESLARDFEGLQELAPVRERIASLDRSSGVKRQRSAERKAVARGLLYRRRELPLAAQALMSNEASPPPVAVLRRQLNLKDLLRDAGEDSEAGLAAQRMLENAFVEFAYYLPRQFRAAKEYARAATSLEVATEIKPLRADVWYNLACVYALGGRSGKSIDALRRAVERGFDDAQTLAEDPDLASIRDKDEYRAIAESLRRGASIEP